MSKKIFILKAETLVAKANCTLCFDSDNEIVIPIPVLDELEKISLQYTEKGRNAKNLLNYLASFKIHELTGKGVIQKNGSILRLVKEDPSIKVPLSGLSSVDLKCLQIASKLKENEKEPVIIVSKSPTLRIKANSIGIKAQNFRDDVYPNLDEQYKGRIKCTSSKQKIDLFYENGFMKVKDIHKYNTYEWMPNMFLTITTMDGKSSAIARYDADKNLIVKLNHIDYHPYKITPKNVGQKMMLEALIEGPETAPIVIIKGGAGTGKTYQTLAVALEQLKNYGNKGIYSQILVSSPVQTVGQERIGFLPGDIEDKFNPHLGGFTDNLKLLLKDSFSNEDEYKLTRDYLFEKANINVQPIGFLRGRTIIDTFYIIDETQNISPDDIKSIVTRAGQGSKVVFLGDPTQIDNPSLNETYNGLVYLSEKMKDNQLTWQITLNDDESVRSELAKIAAKIL